MPRGNVKTNQKRYTKARSLFADRTIDPICESLIVRKFFHPCDSRLEERQLPVSSKVNFTFYDFFFILLVHAVIVRCRNSNNMILLAVG